MMKDLILREYQEVDRSALEDIIRETWKYDQFCSPKVAQKLARVYLDSCLTNQTFTRVAVIDHTPVGIIMGKNIRKHRCPWKLRMKWLRSVVSLYCSTEGRKVSKMFGGIQGIDQQLLSTCGKVYEGELSFFAIHANERGSGLGRTLFQSAVDYMKSQNISEFYLFTDTSCNYPFYDHLGLTRRCEVKQSIDANHKKGDMTFFLYDYHC